MTIVNLMFAIIGTGISLAALIIGLIAWLKTDIRRVEDRLSTMESRLLAVEHSQAKLEGLLEGLREAILARAA